MPSKPALHDVVIVGAGPVGLTLAAALADAGFEVALIERQVRAALSDPQPDGREIALTHRAVDILRSLGLWQRIPAEAVSSIRAARVLNGRSSSYLGFDPQDSGHSALGYLVPNQIIRKAAYAAVAARTAVDLRAGVQIETIQTAGDAAIVQLADGSCLHTRLLVAADSRFSETRRRMGIGAHSRDFGRTVVVCRLAHERPSDGIAYECFGYERTLALLPLNGQMVSAVVTVASDQAEALLQMPPEDFAASLQAQFGARLGRLRLVGERHAYPLVAVHADRFSAHRFALAGDAAVGMHPVTAHGFNLGLYGVDALTRVLSAARGSGRDIGQLQTLSAYDAEHRRATLPLYLGTNALVGLFTDNRLPARLARTAVLRLADHARPLKAALMQRLTDALPPARWRPPPPNLAHPDPSA
ncbi:MAG: 5-demethoxyubiquinol-8 5-hydroxylase UbiM [Stagnimonas sp.]|nr:5-demethoxyubiquinol-8 5-hydroxylase UbiM [Stagnimonas sp.]